MCVLCSWQYFSVIVLCSVGRMAERRAVYDVLDGAAARGAHQWRCDNYLFSTGRHKVSHVHDVRASSSWPNSFTRYFVHIVCGHRSRANCLINIAFNNYRDDIAFHLAENIILETTYDWTTIDNVENRNEKKKRIEKKKFSYFETRFLYYYSCTSTISTSVPI